MKTINSVVLLYFVAVSVFAQSNNADLIRIPFLDASQTNLLTIVNFLRSGHGVPASPSLTNVISNTNLFTRDEQALLASIPVKYQNVATNAGPTGTVLAGSAPFSNELVWVFQYTNVDARDEITFGAMKSVWYSAETGTGYKADLDGRNGGVVNFREFRNGDADGLYVVLDGDRCLTWMRFSEGKAVGKMLMWDRNNSLLLHVEFKEPYDFFRHARQVWK